MVRSPDLRFTHSPCRGDLRSRSLAQSCAQRGGKATSATNPKTNAVRIEEKEFFIGFCFAQGTACSSAPQLILETLGEQGVPTLAREESKGYLGPVVIMEKKFSARSRAVAAVLAVICLAATACKKRAETVPGAATPSQQSPSLEIRPSGAPKTMEPATVGREKESFAHYIHF